MTLSAAVIVVLLGVAAQTYADHFRGGTFNWKPIGGKNSNKVEVTFQIGFNGYGFDDDEATSGHDVCFTKGQKDLETIGGLECDGCEGELPYKKSEDKRNPNTLKWDCTDLNEDGDWNRGGKTFNVSVSKETKTAFIYYQDSSWVDKIQNFPRAKPGYKTYMGWRMNTKININKRNDNGLVNSSPITSPMTLQLFRKGCKYLLQIPVTDPDDDKTFCRYTDDNKGECYNGPQRTMCGKPGYIEIHPNCTLTLDTTGDAPTGYYAVRLMVEDRDKENNTLSKVSLSFLLEVSDKSSTCEGPKIISPDIDNQPVCETIQVGQEFEMLIIAQVADELLPIDHIETSKPTGMVVEVVDENPQRMTVKLTWTPTATQTGKRHVVNFHAVDKGGFTSGFSFKTLNVVDELLSPVPESSNPSEGKTMSSHTGWYIAFNKAIRAPTVSAYITVRNQSSGSVVTRVDTSDLRQVTFNDNKIELISLVLNVNYGNHSFLMEVGENVAVGMESGDCVLHSQAKEWKFLYDGGTRPANPSPKPTDTKVYQPPPYECIDGYENIDVSVPQNIENGRECFVYPQEGSFSVTSRGDTPRSVSVRIPYKLCCESTCTEYKAESK